MNTWMKSMIGCALLVVVGCGGNTTTTTPPAPTNPSPTPQILVPDPTTGTMLPISIDRVVPLDLSETAYSTGTYQGLADITSWLTATPAQPGVVMTPVVGDVLIRALFSNPRDLKVTSKLLLAFEDRIGWWAAQIPSVEGAAFRGTNYIDAIYSDSALTVRIYGLIDNDVITSTNPYKMAKDSSGNLTVPVYGAHVYYRVRQSGETQCQKQEQTPTYDCYPGGYCIPRPLPPAPDIVVPCRNYMDFTNSANTSVKHLGNFKAKWSEWATLTD